MSDRLYPLPDREWLRLQEATTFAFYGVSFSSCLMTLRELKEIDKKRAELNYPCIYGPIDPNDIDAKRQVETEFCEALNEAALSGKVRFQIEGTDIPIWQFKEPREFSLVDDTIRTRVFINDEPVVPHLRDAMVERAGFLSWFQATYPGLCEKTLMPEALPAACAAHGLPANAAIAPSLESGRAARKRRGPKGYGEDFWNKLRAVYVAKLDEVGPPQQGNADPHWRCPADAVRFVITKSNAVLGKHRGDDSEVGKTAAQERVKLWTDEYFAPAKGDPATGDHACPTSDCLSSPATSPTTAGDGAPTS